VPDEVVLGGRDMVGLEFVWRGIGWALLWAWALVAG
jgi:hypothetical protein